MTYIPFSRNQQGGSFGDFIQGLKKRKKRVKPVAPQLGAGKQSINIKKKARRKRKKPTNSNLCHNFALRNSKYAKI